MVPALQQCTYLHIGYIYNTSCTVQQTSYCMILFGFVIFTVWKWMVHIHCNLCKDWLTFGHFNYFHVKPFKFCFARMIFLKYIHSLLIQCKTALSQECHDARQHLFDHTWKAVLYRNTHQTHRLCHLLFMDLNMWGYSESYTALIYTHPTMRFIITLHIKVHKWQVTHSVIWQWGLFCNAVVSYSVVY